VTAPIGRRGRVGMSSCKTRPEIHNKTNVLVTACIWTQSTPFTKHRARLLFTSGRAFGLCFEPAAIRSGSDGPVAC
jgi:hypothetical protein